MNETDFAKMLSAPGAVGLAVMWLHVRMNRVEQRLEMLALHAGAPQPPKKKIKVPVVGALFGLFVLFLVIYSGCARFVTHQEDVSYDAGQPVRSCSTVTKVTTFFDSRASLANSRVTQTDKTQSASLGALSQDASGTNAVDLLERAVGAAVRAAVRP